MDKIKKIKFGLKLWSTNSNLIKEAERIIRRGVFDYVELMVIPDTQISFFRAAKIPYIIHMTSERWGLNIADKKKENPNKEIINRNIIWADKLEARYLILHSGFGLASNAIEFLEKINDKRILIENMPRVGIDNEKMIGYTPEQIKKLIGDRFSFCLDLNHAIKAAISLKENYQAYARDFLRLKPKMLHISDGIFSDKKDKHLNIGEGEYDFKFLANCIKKSQAEYITLETPRTALNSLDEDFKNMQKIKCALFP